MEQSKYLEEISVWEHAPWPGSDRNEEKNKKFLKSDELDSPTQLHDNSTRDDANAKEVLTPDRGEEQEHLLGESDRSSSSLFRDASPDDGEARNDFWSISGIYIYRHLVEPRVKLYVPREESFPIPLPCNKNELGCDVWTPHRRSLEYRRKPRLFRFVDRIHTIHHIGRKTSRWIHVVQGGDWQNGRQHPGQVIYGQKSGKQWEETPSWRRSKSGRMRSSI